MSKKKRVVGYIRVSTPAQATEDKVSLDEQRKDIIAYCERMGYEIVGWYSDIGSGASKRRPNFQRMLKDARKDIFDIIVCWKSDRLSRGMFPAAALIEALEGTDVQLLSVNDAIDRDTFELFAWVGKRELKALSERVRMGMRGKYKNGTVLGPPVYGYKLEGPEGKRHPAIEESEAIVVRRIFWLYSLGQGINTLARILRKEGHITRHGLQWSGPAVGHVLRQTAYIGRSYYGRRKTYRRDDEEKQRDVKFTRKTPMDTWINVDYPAIINVFTWEKVQELRRQPGRGQRMDAKYKLPFMLKGFLFCGDCGRKMTTETSAKYSYYTRKDGTRVKYRLKNPRRRYVCTGKNQYGTSCTRFAISANPIEAKVWGAVDDALTNPDALQALLDARRSELQESGTLNELEHARRRLEAERRKEARLLDLYLVGKMDQGLLDLKSRQVAELRRHYETEVARLEREAKYATHNIDLLDNYRAMASRLACKIESMSYAEREEVVRLFVEKVTHNAEGVNVVMVLDLRGGVTDITPASFPFPA